MHLARHKKRLTVVLAALALWLVTAAAVRAQQQAVAEIWPVSWSPVFEQIRPGTLVLTNRPSETGVILPINRVEFKHPGPKGNEPYTTYLVGSPDPGLQRGAYNTPTPNFKDMFYLQWRVWPPNNISMDKAHWHRELRTEAFVFGNAYWHGSGEVVDHAHRRHQFQGDYLVEEPGGYHFGWTDPNTHENTVFFIFGSEPMTDRPVGPEVPAEKHNSFYPKEKIKWEPGQANGPMVFKMVGDAAKDGYYNEINKWKPGNAARSRKYSADRYGMVVSGRVYIGWGDRTDLKAARLMTQGTFFSQPAGMSTYMFVPAGEQEEAVVIMYGKGPVKIAPVESEGTR